MDIKQAATDLEQFRESLYQNFENRADTLMNLLDAMCSMPEAKSVVGSNSRNLVKSALLRMEREPVKPILGYQALKESVHGAQKWPFSERQTGQSRRRGAPLSQREYRRGQGQLG